MKKALLLAVCLLVVCNKQPTGLDLLDEKNGFRDAKFGRDLKEFQNMVFIGGKGNIKNYMRTTDNLTIDNEKIDKIEYGFFKNKLYQVFITSTNTTAGMSIRMTLERAYGKPTKENKPLKYEAEATSLWEGKKVKLAYLPQSLFMEGGKTYFIFSDINALKEIDKERVKKTIENEL